MFFQNPRHEKLSSINLQVWKAQRASVSLVVVNHSCSKWRHNCSLKPRSSSINELKELTMQTIKQSGVDYSRLVGKSHPQPSDCPCFCQTVKAAAKVKGKGKLKSNGKSKSKNICHCQRQRHFFCHCLLHLSFTLTKGKRQTQNSPLHLSLFTCFYFWNSCDSIHLLSPQPQSLCSLYLQTTINCSSYEVWRVESSEKWNTGLNERRRL